MTKIKTILGVAFSSLLFLGCGDDSTSVVKEYDLNVTQSNGNLLFTYNKLTSNSAAVVTLSPTGNPPIALIPETIANIDPCEELSNFSDQLSCKLDRSESNKEFKATRFITSELYAVRHIVDCQRTGASGSNVDYNCKDTYTNAIDGKVYTQENNITLEDTTYFVLHRSEISGTVKTAFTIEDNIVKP
jgi:hypothetical protein